MKKTHTSCVVLADHSELYSRVSSGFFRCAFYWLLEWAYCFTFDGHICASRYLEKFYAQRLKLLRKKHQVHYSPYAFHPDVIACDEDAGARVKRQFSGKKLILYMGSFWGNYGFWDMLHAFRELVRRRNDFVVLMAGRGPEKASGIAWIDKHVLNDYIRIEGYIAEEDLSAYFSAASGFISPLNDTIQDWARCPSKLFMYLPFEKPVVTCRIGEAAELFGDAGLYYEPSDVDSLVHALDRLLVEESEIETVAPECHTYVARTMAFLKWFNHNYK